jgi:hypothetical protein
MLKNALADGGANQLHSASQITIPMGRKQEGEERRIDR